jgi:hypothetical protein
MQQDGEKMPEIDVLIDKPPNIQRLHETLLKVTAATAAGT